MSKSLITLEKSTGHLKWNADINKTPYLLCHKIDLQLPRLSIQGYCNMTNIDLLEVHEELITV